MNRSTTVIVHYGDPGPTLRLANDMVGFDTDVVVVANDGSARPTGLHERAEWLAPDRNLGYGAAFTTAARGRSTAVYAVLNTDIALSRDTFDRCVQTILDADDVGVVGPVLRHEDGSLQSGAARFSRWLRAPRHLNEPGPDISECSWVCGAVMFIRREVVEQVGMDGSYFLGEEDADLCLRARRAGWRVLCRGDVEAVHHGSRVITGPRWSYYAVRNRIWFVRSNFGLVPALLNWVCSIALIPRVVVADCVKRRDLMTPRLRLMALAHAWWRKPAAEEGPLLGEPFPARIMKW